jgi:hypothetical protein
VTMVSDESETELQHSFNRSSLLVLLQQSYNRATG